MKKKPKKQLIREPQQTRASHKEMSEKAKMTDGVKMEEEGGRLKVVNLEVPQRYEAKDTRHCPTKEGGEGGGGCLVLGTKETIAVLCKLSQFAFYAFEIKVCN